MTGETIQPRIRLRRCYGATGDTDGTDGRRSKSEIRMSKSETNSNNQMAEMIKREAVSSVILRIYRSRMLAQLEEISAISD